MSKIDDIKNRKKAAPLLKRDENNNIIDPNQSREIADQLLKKLATEQRAVEKENSFNLARGRKRDIIVHLAVTVSGDVNGHHVIGEPQDGTEIGQWCFRIPARQLPMRNSGVIKAFAELCHIGKQQLMKMGMVREG